MSTDSVLVAKEVVQLIQGLATIAAIAFGGLWTWLLFVRQRQRFPRADVGIAVHDVVLPQGARLLHAELTIHNTGSVILQSSSAELRLRKVVPLPEDLYPMVEANVDPVREGDAEVKWPLITQRTWTFKPGEFEIEPGEADSLHADFVIQLQIEVVEFYAFVGNAKKTRKKLGWALTKTHSFRQDKEVQAVSQDGNNKEMPITEQQERRRIQQPQQKPQQPQQQQQPKRDDKKK